MTIHFGLSALGTPTPTGTVQPSVGLSTMKPGWCCYDPSRPSWLPSWIKTDAEDLCLFNTNNCAVASISYAPPSSTLPCTQVSADGKTCVAGVPAINDKTGVDLSAGQPTDAAAAAAAAAAARASATGLTPGGCPDGQDGTYPDCGSCAWYQGGTYPNCSGITGNVATALLVAFGAVFVFGVLKGR